MKNWLETKIVTKTIDGQQVRFRKIPIGTLRKFKCVNKDVAKALTMLFKDTQHDIKVTNLSVPSEVLDADGKPVLTQSYEQTAAEPSIISMRKTQMEEGIKALIDAVTGEESFNVIAEVICKSAWETFSDDDIPKVQDNMGFDTVVEFVKGAIEASAGDYAELGKSLFQNNSQLQAVLERVKAIQK